MDVFGTWCLQLLQQFLCSCLGVPLNLSDKFIYPGELICAEFVLNNAVSVWSYDFNISIQFFVQTQTKQKKSKRYSTCIHRFIKCVSFLYTWKDCIFYECILYIIQFLSFAESLCKTFTLSVGVIQLFSLSEK